MTGKAIAAAILFGSSIAACAHAVEPRPAIGEAAHREDILAVVDAFFLAIAKPDADVVAASFAEGAVNVIAEPEKGAAIRYRPASVMAERMRKGEFPQFRESYWDPVVLERGGLAVVWAPYAIDEGGKRVQCGVDIFNLSKHADGWKIDSLNFTMEPNGCDEISPAADSVVRPDFSVLDAKEE